MLHIWTLAIVAVLSVAVAEDDVRSRYLRHSESNRVVVRAQPHAVLLRAGETVASNTVPGWGGPSWGGQSFEDSIANNNPWTKVRDLPVVGDLNPVAPQDRLDKKPSALASAAPLEPGQIAAEAVDGAPPTLTNDWLPDDSFPRTFPKGGADQSEYVSSPQIEWKDRNLIASGDKMRPPYAWRSSGNYPLIAPGDRIISSRGKALGWVDGASGYDPRPVSSSEKLPQRFSKYIEQVHERTEGLAAATRLDNAFRAFDSDENGMISHEEYYAQLVGKQNKTELEAKRLWERTHRGASDSLSKDEFARLYHIGFDLGSIAREDITSMLPIDLPGFSERGVNGFWGSGAACPTGEYVIGARLKVASPNLTESGDDTGLNAVGFRCSRGDEVGTIEGGSGEWTNWTICPTGQRVFSVRAQVSTYMDGGDNTAMGSLELGCRRPDLGAMGKLRFFDRIDAEYVGSEPTASASSWGGGWTGEKQCDPHSAVCGAQAQVVRDQGSDGDNLGIAALRVYCCTAPVDCSEACGETNGGDGSVRCRVCRQASGEGQPLPQARWQR